MNKDDRTLSARAVHSGFKPIDSYRSAAEPLYPASTYIFPDAESAERAFEGLGLILFGVIFCI